jgi:DNA-binding NarL/FixJ family response regulator
MTPIRLLIVDDHKVLAEGLAARLESQDDFNVVAAVGDAASARAATESLKPDLVILDVKLPDADGIELAHELHQLRPELKILILTALDDPERVVEAVRAGVIGWVRKEGSIQDLTDALRAAVRGASWIPTKVLGDVLMGVHNRRSEEDSLNRLLESLTPRELEIFRWMVEGLDRASIADKMFLSQNTVRTHTRNLFEKLGVHSVLEAVGLGLRAGLRPSVQFDEQSRLRQTRRE